jgi:hypothetical protein
MQATKIVVASLDYDMLLLLSVSCGLMLQKKLPRIRIERNHIPLLKTWWVFIGITH